MSRSEKFQKSLAVLVCEEIAHSDGNAIVLAKIAGDLATAMGHTIAMMAGGDRKEMQRLLVKLEERVFKASLRNSDFAKDYFA